MAAIVNKDTCTGCGICVEVCPVTAIKLDAVAKVDEGTCTDCGACVDECPVTAISMK
jgi:ferredoxin